MDNDYEMAKDDAKAALQRIESIDVPDPDMEDDIADACIALKALIDKCDDRA